jgi:hypothetical protein
MTAEVLRQAAALMRERSEAATPGPWTNTLGTLSEVWQHESVGTDLMVCDTQDTYTIYPEDGPGEGAAEDAAHIASWHPAVALAVADWLDAAADSAEYLPPETGQPSLALAVAHAYLGTQP